MRYFRHFSAIVDGVGVGVEVALYSESPLSVCQVP